MRNYDKTAVCYDKNDDKNDDKKYKPLKFQRFLTELPPFHGGNPGSIPGRVTSKRNRWIISKSSGFIMSKYRIIDGGFVFDYNPYTRTVSL